jgi:hypothetical protein
VEVSNVIHVSNLPENIHSDTILLYFENKSKVGIVKNVIRLDKASCLVYFEDYKGMIFFILMAIQGCGVKDHIHL